jgi:TPR repeat protein
VRDVNEAARVYRVACDEGSVGGCVNWLAVLLQAEPPAMDELALARDKCVTFCEEGIVKACNNVGQAYLAASDYARATSLFRRACDGGDGNGCTNLARQYRYGRGVGRDESEAAKLNAHGCDLGAFGSCNNLGDQYETGAGVPASLDQAIALYERACSHAFAFGCFSLGELYAKRPEVKDPSKAALHYEKACGLGEPHSCAALARMLAVGDGVAVDEARSRRMLQQACAGGYKPACTEGATR